MLNAIGGMEMRIILAAHSTSTRKVIIEELSSIQSHGGKAMLIVPEQATMQTDMALLNALDSDVLMDIHVRSFSSLARDVLGKVGGLRIPYVNESGRRMMVQYLLNKHRSELPMYGKGAEQSGICDKLAETLGDYRSVGVAPETLEQLAQLTDASPLICDKLTESAAVYRAYLELLGDTMVDNTSRLFLLADKLPFAKWLSGLPIYLDGFYSLSGSEMAVLAGLEKNGAEVTVALELPQRVAAGNASATEMQVFAVTRRFYHALCAQFDVHIEVCNDAPDVLYDLDILSSQVLGCRLNPEEGVSPHLAIWKATSPQLEVLTICGVIRREVIEHERRWRDFQIVTNQPAIYYPLFSRAFAQYQIPAFVDERKPMSYHYFVRFMLNILDAVNTRFSYPVLFSCLKTGLTPLNDAEIAAFDYFARVRHLRGSMYFEERWFEAPEDEVRTRKAERLRVRQSHAFAAHKKFTAWFEPFWKDIREAGTVREQASVLYHFITNPDIMDAFHAHDEDKSSEQKATDAQILDTLAALLDQLVDVMGELEISLSQFASVLKEGVQNVTLGILPPAQDQVQVTNLSRVRQVRSPIEIMVGCTDAWMPATTANHTVFMRQEKEWLDAHGLSLPSGERFIRDDEALSIYNCMSRPTERLILSYPLSDAGGVSMNASSFVQHALTVFPEMKEKSLLADIDEIRPYLEWESLKSAMSRYRLGKGADEDGFINASNTIAWFAQNRPELARFLDEGLRYDNLRTALPRGVAEALYPALKGGRVSASELEAYKACPYMHFMRYGIRPEETPSYVLQSDEMGNVLHGCLDRLTADLCNHPDWINMSDEEIAVQIDRYLDFENERQIDRQRRELSGNAALVRQVRRQTVTAGKYILAQLRMSRFAPSYHEVSFAQENAPFPPVYLDIGDRVIRVEGCIDRIDTANINNSLYVRVIDYKSGSKTFDMAAAWDGLDMQLLLYLRAVLGAENAPLPAGVFYMSMKEPLQKTDSANDEDIQKAFTKQLLLDGIFIDDPDVIAALDEAVGSGDNQVIRFAGSGKTAVNCLDSENFKALLEHTVQVAAESVKAVLEGDISIYPVEEALNRSCAWCDYKSICRNDVSAHGNERLLEKVGYKDLQERLKEKGESQ